MVSPKKTKDPCKCAKGAPAAEGPGTTSNIGALCISS